MRLRILRECAPGADHRLQSLDDPAIICTSASGPEQSKACADGAQQIFASIHRSISHSVRMETAGR